MKKGILFGILFIACSTLHLEAGRKEKSNFFEKRTKARSSIGKEVTFEEIIKPYSFSESDESDSDDNTTPQRTLPPRRGGGSDMQEEPRYHIISSRALKRNISSLKQKLRNLPNEAKLAGFFSIGVPLTYILVARSLKYCCDIDLRKFDCELMCSEYMQQAPQ